MASWFSYLSKAFKVAGVLMTRLPEIVADGKVTLEELCGLIEDLSGALDFKTSFEVPDDLKDQVIGVSGQ